MTKKASMTNRERVEALLRREKPDRVPIWSLALGFNTIYSGDTIGDYYETPAVSYAAQKKTCHDFDWVFAPWNMLGVYAAEEFGGDIKWPRTKMEQCPMVARFPIETPEEVWKLEVPDPKTAGYAPRMWEFSRIAAKESEGDEPFYLAINPGSGPFTGTANICGTDKLVKWFLKAPDAAERLLRIGLDYFLEYAKLFKATFGTERVLPLVGEPCASNYLISPQQFEQWALPCIQEYCDAVLSMGYKHIWAHLCGEHNLNLPHWKKVNFGDPGIISLAHELNLEECAEVFPNDIMFGNLNPATLAAETPEKVYEETKNIVERGKALKTGFIFSQGCELAPYTPLENIQAMNKAVEDHGWYE